MEIYNNLLLRPDGRSHAHFFLGACKVAGEYDEASERDFQRLMEQQAKLEEEKKTNPES